MGCCGCDTIYLDPVNGSSGGTGIFTDPCQTITQARVLANAAASTHIGIIQSTSTPVVVSLDQAYDGFSFLGAYLVQGSGPYAIVLNLNNKSVEAAEFEKLTVVGTVPVFVPAFGMRADFERCILKNLSGGLGGIARDCYLEGSIAPGLFLQLEGCSMSPNATTVDLNYAALANQYVLVRDSDLDLNLKSMSLVSQRFRFSGTGSITIDASNTNGAIDLFGSGTVQNDGTATVSAEGFLQNVLEARGSFTYEPSLGIVRANLWLQSQPENLIVGVSNATAQLFDRIGNPLTTVFTSAAPDSKGVFEIDLTVAAFTNTDTATYFVVTIDFGGVTYRSVVGATFSRSC